MKLEIGKDFFELKKGINQPVCLDTSQLVNGHLLMIGASGTGKSYMLRRLIRQAQAQGTNIRFHVFDVHGDLSIPGESVARFSEQSDCGLNPLEVNPDPYFGGVRKSIQSFIRTLNQASVTALGVKQEAVLRQLLEDVYLSFGFSASEPSSWALNSYESHLLGGGSNNRLYLNVPLAEKDEAKGLGARWDPGVKCWWVAADAYHGAITRWSPAYKPRTYPTLHDVITYAERILDERLLGSYEKAIRALDHLNKSAKALQRRWVDSIKEGRQRANGMAADDEATQSARTKAIEAFTEYVHAVRTGEELDSFRKYDSSDVLKSVIDRLRNLRATGLFKAQPAPFDPGSPVWRYRLEALSPEEKKMFVLFTLQDLFLKAIQRGEQSSVVEVVVLDELGTFTSNQDEDGGDGIIGVIARQARKFGLAIWAADQMPKGIPESLISSVAVKIVLGVDERFWTESVNKLRMETRQLEWIQAHVTAAVQLKEKRALKNRWRWVSLSQS